MTKRTSQYTSAYTCMINTKISWRKLENKKGEKDKGYIKVYGDNKDTCGGKWKIKDSLD